MIRLIVLLLVVSLGWMSWWAFGSYALERSLTSWIETSRSQGIATNAEAIDVRGFPSRFDTTITNVTLQPPGRNVTWSGTFLQLLALAYKPHQVIAVLPNQHHVETPLQAIDITNDQARGSIFLQPSTSLPLERSTIVIDKLNLNSSLGWSLSLDQARIATEQIEARTNAHRIGAEILQITLPTSARETLDPTETLPPQIARLHLDATADFTAPWDRHALETTRPQISALNIADLSANWGDIGLSAKGLLSLTPSGTPEGEITLEATNWKRLFNMAVEAGLISRPDAPNVENALQLIALLSGNADALEVPLTFRAGGIFLGPIPLGPAPRIVIP